MKSNKIPPHAIKYDHKDVTPHLETTDRPIESVAAFIDMLIVVCNTMC